MVFFFYLSIPTTNIKQTNKLYTLKDVGVQLIETLELVPIVN